MLYLKYKFCLKNWRFNDSVFFISCPQFLFCNSNILLYIVSRSVVEWIYSFVLKSTESTA
jgi:hypothetical protein